MKTRPKSGTAFKQPLVTVSVVTYNSVREIAQCLRSVVACRYPNLEIVVVDNSSVDKTLEVVEKFRRSSLPPMPGHRSISTPIRRFSRQWVILRQRKNLGYAAGHNLAVSRVRGEYVLLLNPDTTITSRSIEPLITVLLGDKRVAAVQPLVYLKREPRVLNLSGKVTHYLGFDWLRDYRQTQPSSQKQLLSVSGSGVLVSKAAFIAAGGFDDNYFMYYEDSDLSWRWRLLGYRLLFVPESVFYHDYKFLPDENYLPAQRKFFLAERNRLLTVAKNYQLRTLLLVFPVWLGFELALVVYSFLTGYGWSKLRSYLGFCLLLPAVAESRVRLGKLRRRSDHDVTTPFATRIDFVHFSHPVLHTIVNPLLDAYWQLIRNWI